MATRELLQAMRDETPDDEMERAALDVLRASYWADVRSFAEEIAQLVKDTDDEDWRDEAIVVAANEYADGSQWVIYTWRAYVVALASSNADAGEDEMGEHELVRNADSTNAAVTTAAFFAMRADIATQVAALVPA